MIENIFPKEGFFLSLFTPALTVHNFHRTQGIEIGQPLLKFLTILLCTYNSACICTKVFVDNGAKSRKW